MIAYFVGLALAFFFLITTGYISARNGWRPIVTCIGLLLMLFVSWCFWEVFSGTPVANKIFFAATLSILVTGAAQAIGWFCWLAQAMCSADASSIYGAEPTAKKKFWFWRFLNFLRRPEAHGILPDDPK